MALACAACGHPPPPPAPPAPPPPRARTLTILGTNDFHGSLQRLPILAGFVANVRAARAADGGAVLLIDAGDMFQGTLESNLNEGKAVIEAYSALGYSAAAVGNHEFDFGPAGPAVTAQGDDDPRGALKDRAGEAKFPLLTANILDAESGNRIKWQHMPASTTVKAAGITVGIIGVTTEATPFTTMPANFAGLRMGDTAAAIKAEAERLRGDGADFIVVAAHIGGKCTDFANPDDASSCDGNEELPRLLDALPPGTIDMVVGGHTHSGMAHRIGKVAVIESYSSARAFGRVDLRISGSGVITAVKIHPPQLLCPVPEGQPPPPPAECKPPDYEGRPVVPDPQMTELIAPYLEAAKARREEPIGVEVAATLAATYDAESPAGNLFADLMLQARPDADVALTNGGGLRADVPAGPLTYGAVYESQPFDNRFAIVTLQGRHLRKLIADNLQAKNGIFSWAGLTARARCKKGQLDIQLFDRRGRPIADGKTIKVATSDFLASGGDDGIVGRLDLPAGAVQSTDVVIRDAMVAVLRKRGGKLAATDLYSTKKPRLAYPAPRPVSCVGAPAAP